MPTNPYNYILVGLYAKWLAIFFQTLWEPISLIIYFHYTHVPLFEYQIYHSTVYTEYRATINRHIENDINVALAVAHNGYGLKRVKHGV